MLRRLTAVAAACAGVLYFTTVASGAAPTQRARRVHTEQERPVQITRAGSQPSVRGPAEWFTGTVRIDPVFPVQDPSRSGGNNVTFEPGARTAWHTHPLGQTLIVLSGRGRVQREGGPIEEIRPGDVVWIPPHTRHWHGASPETAMQHLAIQEYLDGKPVEWLEHVSDAQYLGTR